MWNAPIPEKLLSLISSDDGKYIIGGGATGIAYLWESQGGKLITQWQAHFNQILAVGFFENSIIVTAGKDSMIHCWLIGSLFKSGEITPFKSWSAHSLPVTSLFCSFSRILSSSLDHTCKLFSISSNEPLCSIVFPAAVNVTTMNNQETAIYAGARFFFLFFIY